MLCLNGRAVSIEDVYECKRPVSVPGISVNVRRVKVRTSLLVEKQAPTFFFIKAYCQILWRKSHRLGTRTR
jgi:hypothetical protein